MGCLAPFGLRHTHGILMLPGVDVRDSSEGQHWTSLFASAQREAAYEAMFPAVEDQLLVLHVDGPVEVRRLLGETSACAVVPAGGVHLIPGGMELGIALCGELTTVHVYVRRAIIEEVAAHLVRGDPAKVEIPPLFAATEPALGHLIRLVEIEMSDEEIRIPAYADYLARAIAARLVRSHSTAEARGAAEQRPRPRGKCPIVARAIEYMNAHLDESLTLDEIAEAAGRSPSHFARQFKCETGAPPHQYLLDLRVERAQKLLAETRLPIAEIAYACGFSHQEHMTRLFRKRCDTTPGAYRRSRRN